MIEKLLDRIAKRGAASEPHVLAAVVSSRDAKNALISSAGSQDPFSTVFPAPQRGRGVQSGATPPSINAWQLACQQYTEQRVAGIAMADQPAFFADWSPAHLAVAQMLWSQRDQLHKGEVHIFCGDKLLAVTYPAKRRVVMRLSAYQPHAPLALQQLQEHAAPNQAAQPVTAADQACSLHSLLWFYGQVYSEAPEHLPPEIGTNLIQLRRFPLVEPAALEMRHLALIHIFSGGALTFVQLQKHVSPMQLDSLCPDLASLYFTGAIRLLADPANRSQNDLPIDAQSLTVTQVRPAL